MLETIREYTRERLDDGGGTAEYALRHARWYLARLQANYPDRSEPDNRRSSPGTTTRRTTSARCSIA
jgi:hypothetical protein